MPIDYNKRPQTPVPPGSEPVQAAAAPRPTIELRKGAPPVTLTKTSTMQARASWSSKTDYDVYALVVLRDGTVQTVAMFGAQGVPPQQSFRGIRHLGDVTGRGTAVEAAPRRKIFANKATREAEAKEQAAWNAQQAAAQAVELIQIGFQDDIVAVVPVAYSAQSNGSGSFARYSVALEVENGQGEAVRVSSEEANDDDNIFTCVPAIIYNRPDGVEVERVELYSAKGSENRPAARLVQGRVVIDMDAGPRNDYK